MPRSVYTSGTRRSVTRLRLARLGRVHRSDLSHHVPNSWSSGRADTPVIRPAAASPVMEGHAFKSWGLFRCVSQVNRRLCQVLRAHPAEQSSHLGLENTTSESAGWKAGPGGRLCLIGCDTRPMLASPLPSCSFSHQPEMPICISTSLYSIILTPRNLHLHSRLHMTAMFIMPPMKRLL